MNLLVRNIINKINKRKNLKELKSSNFGRKFGWFIEFEGEIIGELIDYEFYDMFWDSYRIIPKNKEWHLLLFSKKFWHENDFKFKNKHYNIYVPNAIPKAGSNLKIRKRIKIRGLYLSYQ